MAPRRSQREAIDTLCGFALWFMIDAVRNVKLWIIGIGLALLACGGPQHVLTLPEDGVVNKTDSTFRVVEGYLTVQTTGIKLWYRDSGDSDAPPVILLNGSDFPANMWHGDFVQSLLDADLRVIQFDPRDCGRSERLPWPDDFKARKWTPEKPPPYPLTAIRDDLVGLMDGLEIESAHMIGVSMGGMIAQLMVLEYPVRVRSLTLMSTSPSNSFDQTLDNPSEQRQEEIGGLFKKAAVAYYVSRSDKWKERFRVTMQEITGATDNGADFMKCLDEMESLGEFNFMSGHGFAIVTAPSRLDDLHQIKAPTLILHGTADPWFRYSHAELLQKEIAGSVLVPIEAEGHALPRNMYNKYAGQIADHIKSQESASAASGQEANDEASEL